MVVQFNKWLFIASLSLSLLFWVGCNKTTETYPIENVPLNVVFDPTDSLGTNAQQFLYDIYSNLPQGYNRVSGDVLDAGSDDAIPSTTNRQVEYFSTGKIEPYILPDNSWIQNYASIRSSNIFLANIDVVPLNLVGQKSQWKAEARFLRAMAYFELVKRWGGVPLVGDKIYAYNDKITTKRNSYDECVQYISNELDSAAGNLPVSYSGSTSAYFGRATKGAAMAIKARLLLYAASSLNNPTNNISKWQAAANAAQAVMSSGTYSLVTGTNGIGYYNLFITRQTSEVILAYYTSPSSSVESSNGPVGSARGDKGLTSPTQELVDAFEMANGKAITDVTSGYDPTKPYSNRDPRLGNSIFFNGQSWLGRTIQTYDGGIDRPAGYGNATSGETRTGYYMRKMLSTAGTNTTYSNAEHNFPIIRYAEILLDYAEAQNEAVGPDASVYSAINQIRQRAGLNPYVLPAGLTQAQMRDKIRHERRVELAFEEQRFWDIRRWKIAETVLNGTLHGVQIIQNSDGSFTYKVVAADQVSFDASKMYLYPIPYQEVISNSNLEQNPNW